MRSPVILDNTVLNLMVKSETVDLPMLLRTILNNGALIPMQVLLEFGQMALVEANPLTKSKIIGFSERVNVNSFFKLCTTYDPIVLDFLKQHIDSGEAEAVAQSIKTQTSYFITDDFRCTVFINEKYPNIHTYSSFYLLALADVHGFLPDYESVVAEYLKLNRYEQKRNETRKRLKERLRFEYSEALRYLGRPSDTKIISQKTGLKKILEKAKGCDINSIKKNASFHNKTIAKVS